MYSDKAQNVHAYLCIHSLDVLLNLHASIYCTSDNHTYLLFKFDRAFTSAHSGLILVRHSQVYPSVRLFDGDLFSVFMTYMHVYSKSLITSMYN